MNDYAIQAVRLGGALHFVQIPAMIGLLRTAWRLRLDRQIPATLLRILMVLGGGIVLAVASGGLLALLMDPTTLSSRLGVAFVTSWALFWVYRMLAQVFVYGPVIPLGARWVHWSLVFIFVVKSSAYSYAALDAITK